jgi:hypothetical protein
MANIYNVQAWNKIQETAKQEYLDECKGNNCPPQSKYMQDVMFPTFDYKKGFVRDGLYPMYRKRKKDLE